MPPPRWCARAWPWTPRRLHRPASARNICRATAWAISWVRRNFKCVVLCEPPCHQISRAPGYPESAKGVLCSHRSTCTSGVSGM
jgi:hypothetical protein